MDENLRGAFYGISLSHNRAHFMRAVMEGICFNMKTIYDEFNKIAGNDPEIAIASGGFIKSNLWTKMMASILDMPLLIPKNKGYQASIGAAMMAGIGTGVYHSLQEAVDTCVSFEDYIAEPDINFIGYYAEKYGQIQEWDQDYEELEVGHRHISQLFALYPAQQIRKDQTPKLAQAAVKNIGSTSGKWRRSYRME